MKYNFLCLCAFFLVVSTIQKMNFERKIFVFWETPMNQAPILIKVSFEKLQIAAERDGWELHLIHKDNIQEYLPDYKRFQEVVKKGHRNTVHERSDILRIYLIEQHGGIWLDFCPVLFQNLDWLSDDKLFDHLIINKIGNSTDDPGMLMLGQGFHQSPYSYINSDNRLVSQEFFGTAIHFIAAKRKAPIMTLWKNKFDTLATQSYNEMMPELIHNRIYVKNIYQSDVYLSANVALESVIQQQQHQLDDQIKLWDLFSERQNVYQHFKIWQVHGEVGPIMIGRFDRLHIAHLFGRTKQEVESKTGKLWFYLKICNYWRKEVLARQNLAQEYFTKYSEKTIASIIKRGPTYEECRLFLIVKGSILHILYENSKYSNEIKTPFITIEQRDMMRRYCDKINPDMYALVHQPQWPPIGQVTKAKREIQFSNMTSLSERIALIPKIYDEEIKTIKLKWSEACKVIMFYLLVRNLSVLAYCIFKCIKSRLMERQQGEPIIAWRSVENYLDKQKLKAKVLNLLVDCSWKNSLAWVGFNALGLGLLYGKAFAYAITYQFYEEVDVVGFMGLWTKICLVLGYNVILDWVIGKFLNHKYVNTFVSMETILKETRILLYIPVAYVAVFHMYLLFGYAHHHTMNFVAGGILVYVWLEEIKERRIGFSLLYKIESILANTKWAFLGLFLLYRLNRNIRYIRFEQHYAKELLADMLNDGFWILLYSLTLVAGVYFFKKLFVIECTEVQRGPQTEAEKEQRVTKRADIYHSLFMLMIIWLVVSKTSQIYASKLASFYTVDYGPYFRIYIGLYTACVSFIRLKFNMKVAALFWLLVGLHSIVPIMYFCTGESFTGWLDWREHMKQTCRMLIVINFVIIEHFRRGSMKQTQETEKPMFEKIPMV